MHAISAVALALSFVATSSSAVAPSIAATSTSRRSSPPWISIEYPANPFDRTARGAFLLVHAFQRGVPTTAPVTGTAEGVVNGRRRTIPLEFERTSSEGVYSLRRQWDGTGAWTLVITVADGTDGMAQALVSVATSGQVTAIQVPTRAQGEWQLPRRATAAEIEALVRR